MAVILSCKKCGNVHSCVLQILTLLQSQLLWQFLLSASSNLLVLVQAQKWYWPSSSSDWATSGDTLQVFVCSPRARRWQTSPLVKDYMFNLETQNPFPDIVVLTQFTSESSDALMPAVSRRLGGWPSGCHFMKKTWCKFHPHIDSEVKYLTELLTWITEL